MHHRVAPPLGICIQFVAAVLAIGFINSQAIDEMIFIFENANVEKALRTEMCRIFFILRVDNEIRSIVMAQVLLAFRWGQMPVQIKYAPLQANSGSSNVKIPPEKLSF